MILKILSHPIFIELNYHMPMVVDLRHPFVLLAGENGCGKSTLLQSTYYALRGEQLDGYVYRVENPIAAPRIFLFDAEQHNPRMHLELFENNPPMREFVQLASHGQIMLSMFDQTFPSLPDGTMLLLDEPEMALSENNQRRVIGLINELIRVKHFRVICATHSAVFKSASEAYVIDLDRHINRNVRPAGADGGGPGAIQ
jgi:predicted ATPase